MKSTTSQLGLHGGRPVRLPAHRHPRWCRRDSIRLFAVRWIGWAPFLILPFGALAVQSRVPPWGFMWLLVVALFAAAKWLIWWQAWQRFGRPAVARCWAYFFAWPGMEAAAFLQPSATATPPSRRQWVAALLKTGAGAVLLGVAPAQLYPIDPLCAGWAGMVGLALFAHFGLLHLLALCWQRQGIPVRQLFCRPAAATSVSDFWGNRWNRAFRDLVHAHVFRPVIAYAGIRTASSVTFLVSGIAHELAISLPAGAGYGLPTAYFLLQAAAVRLEHSRLGHRLALRRGLRGWLFTLLCTAGPAFWLFHRPFVLNVVVPFLRVINAL